MPQFPDNLEHIYAPEMKGVVASFFDGDKPVVLDLQNVRRASLACIQIILAAHSKAKRDGVQLVIESSESFTLILSAVGCGYILEEGTGLDDVDHNDCR